MARTGGVVPLVFVAGGCVPRCRTPRVLAASARHRGSGCGRAEVLCWRALRVANLGGHAESCSRGIATAAWLGLERDSEGLERLHSTRGEQDIEADWQRVLANRVV